ncbi:Spo0B domain-containing protein [Cohnella yongneupensis]|uniref:Spo0B domain-containing protein n=1 Tax=Cohnella yongneupensis TaxID=425006 RepID=A0ABW0QXL8_9BACL
MRIRKITPLHIVAASSLAFPIAAVFGWPDAWWPLILFMLWSLALGVALATAGSREDRERIDRLLDHAHGSAIQTLSHHRHDWMNELQVLYGYLRLNKPDKAVDVVDRIRVRMDHDSRLSHIGNPKLSIYLLSFRTICDSLRLDVEVQDGLQFGTTPREADRLAQAVIGMINVIRVRSGNTSAYDSTLKLAIAQSAVGYQVDLTYAGELAAADSVDADLARCLDGVGDLVNVEPIDETQHARTMSVRFPLHA